MKKKIENDALVQYTLFMTCLTVALTKLCEAKFVYMWT
jgi:hypothetical protein